MDRSPSDRNPTDKSSPVGVFDSGLGGLTVFRELLKVLPHENIIYLGDTARVPYGTRSAETIIKFSFEDTEFLRRRCVKCIVIACNTSSAVAGDQLKSSLKLPVFEVISSAVKEALKTTKNNKIGVIGTRGTIGSKAYQEKLLNQNPNIEVIASDCPLFVPFIEEGEIKSKALKMIAKKYLEIVKKGKVDTLILGCTHYPIISKIIQKEMGLKVKLIDPGKSEAKEVYNYLKEHNLLNNGTKTGTREYFVTDYTDRFIKTAEMFLSQSLKGKIRKATL